MEEANDSQGGVHPFSFFLFLFFTDTRHRHTLENSRACKFSAVPPPLLPSPPEDSFRGNEKTWLYRNCFAVFRPAYTISPSPHFFLSIFLPRSPRHAVSTPTQTRQRSVHEWNSASNRNAPPCASPSLGKKRGVGS